MAYLHEQVKKIVNKWSTSLKPDKKALGRVSYCFGPRRMDWAFWDLKFEFYNIVYPLQ